MKIKVNTENLVCSLFILGYECLEPFMYTKVLSTIIGLTKKDKTFLVNVDNEKYDCEIVFENDRIGFSEEISSFIDVSFGSCLNSKYNMDNKVGPFMKLNCDDYSFEKYIKPLNNKLLACYISQYVDLYKILIDKINSYNSLFGYIDNYSEILCDKERDMILDIFGINDMLERRAKNSQRVHKYMYDQENIDIDNAINTLNKIKK